MFRSYSKGKKAFNIDFDKAIVQLSERDNAVIPKNKFVCTIERLANCACFQVNLQLMDDSAAIVTPHVSFSRMS